MRLIFVHSLVDVGDLRNDRPFFFLKFCWVLPIKIASHMEHLLHILYIESWSEWKISAFHNQGLSADDQTARVSWHLQYVFISAVIDHCTCFLSHLPHQCTPPWRYPKFLPLLFASSQSERRIYALPNMGLSVGEITEWIIWYHCSISVFYVLDHCTYLLGHRPHQCTLPDCILD